MHNTWLGPPLPYVQDGVRSTLLRTYSVDSSSTCTLRSTYSHNLWGGLVPHYVRVWCPPACGVVAE